MCTCQPPSRTCLRFVTIVLVAVLAAQSTASADPGKPVAVHWWGQATVSIETYWNLRIVIDPFALGIGYDNPHLAADLVLITHEHPDHNNEALVEDEPIVVRGLTANGRVAPLRRILDRLPNQERPTWTDANVSAIRSTHEVTVTAVPAWHDDEQGRNRGANAMFVIDVDGLRIVHCGDLGQSRLTDEQLQALGHVDVLLIPVGGIYTIDGRQAVDVIAQVKPRVAIPIHFKTPALTFGLRAVEPFIEAVGDRWPVRRHTHNTLAICSELHADELPAGKGGTEVALLDYQPWQPRGELADLFARMERACRDAQAVFDPLSIDQMNFRPSDGTHTPRWNAEHMMGRELLFFTQIYARREPAIAPMDLNPAQMPPDYKAAHPTWSGAEEARQMERVSALARRFGYLLEDVDLGKQAAGSAWSPRRLFLQMESHYGEHTANVKKKFLLPDWPVN